MNLIEENEAYEIDYGRGFCLEIGRTFSDGVALRVLNPSGGTCE